jgi:hypothetical protein
MASSVIGMCTPSGPKTANKSRHGAPHTEPRERLRNDLVIADIP